MAKLGIGSRLNNVSRKSIIDTTGYKSVMLDPETLIPSQENFYSQENIEELADNMKLVGYLQPILVGRVKGEDRVISGHRRRLAVLMNKERGVEGFNEIECLIKEMSENMFMLTLLSANMFNRKLTDWEMMEQARQFKEYLTKASQEDGVTIEGKMRDYIADAMGVSHTKMAQIEKINNSLCDEGKEALKKGEINFTTAYETSKLPQEQQKKVLDSKHLLSKDVKELVEQQKESGKGVRQEDQTEDINIPGQMNVTDYPEFEPEPDRVNSLCYGCLHWKDCNQKGSTVTSCNEYVNKAEAEKTDEQRYSEQQDAIDKQTAKVLKQREDDEKMDKLPSDEKQEKKIHRIKEAAVFYQDVKKGIKSFELRRNDRGYKVGDSLEMMEYKNGEETGKCLFAEIVYMLDDYSGLEEGYCILEIKVTGEVVM